MKKDIHPEYREVIFRDTMADFSIKTRSTVKTKDTIVWEDGQEYPLVKLDISSASHPFYTGSSGHFVDTAGRIEKFQRKYKEGERAAPTKKDEKKKARVTRAKTESLKSDKLLRRRRRPLEEEEAAESGKKEGAKPAPAEGAAEASAPGAGEKGEAASTEEKAGS